MRARGWRSALVGVSSIPMLVTAADTELAEAAVQCSTPVIAASADFVEGPTVSADGSRIAFSSDANFTGGNADGNEEIFLYDAGTDQITQLTSSTQGSAVDSNSEASISDDGTRVAFQSDRNYNGTNATGYEIFLWDEAGSTITQLTNVAAFAFTGGPSISGDGSTVAFQSDGNVAGLNSDLNFEIFLVDVGTTAVSGVTDTSGPAIASFLPSLSADGNEVAFESSADLTGGNSANNSEIFLYDADTDDTTQLTTTGGGGQSDWAAISGSGNRVAFRSSGSHGPGTAAGNTEIFVKDVASGAITALTSTNGGDNRDPSISADGNRVVFESNRNIGGQNPNLSGEVFLWERSTGLVTQASPTTATVDDQQLPDLSASGEVIAFYTGDGNDNAIATTTCARPPRPDALIATAATGPFKGANVYSATVTSGQTKSQTIARGTTRTFHVKLQNDGPELDELKVKGVASGSAGYTIRYLSGTTDITAAVVAGTYSTGALAPGASVTIKVKITATSSAAVGSARNADVTARSATDPSIKDTVRARVTRS